MAVIDYVRDANGDLLRRVGFENEKRHEVLTYVADVAATSEELLYVEHGEKVDVLGFINVRGRDFAQCQSEMIATMLRSPGADPLEHDVLSWLTREQPTKEQIQEAAKIYLKAMGLAEHQAFFAAHSNTQNYHLHIVVNRVHPATFERIAAGGDWQVDSIHQAVAMIEHAQWRASEPGAIYQADEHGVVHRASGIRVRDADGATGRYPTKQRRASEREHSASAKEKLPLEDQLSEGARAYERRTHLESFERVAKTVARRHVHEARSWPDLHARLSEGPYIRNRRKRSPDRLGCAKAGRIANRSAALGQMEKRKGFGPYVPRDPGTPVRDRAATPLNGDMDVSRYWAARRAHVDRLSDIKREIASQRAAVRQEKIAI